MTGAEGTYPDTAGGPTDSAGVPWSGRSLPDAGFTGDTGAADPALLAAMTGADDATLVPALVGARVLVPVAAVAAEVGEGVEGLHSDKETDMAVVLLDHPDGRTALPVFTSLAALADFDPALRPVPVTAERAAQAAISEGADVVVVDCASPQAREVRRSMMWALAQDQAWLPAHEDPFVQRAVAAACAPHDAVVGHALAEGEPAGEGVLLVELTLRQGLTATEVQTLVTAVAEQMATDGELRARVDGLSFRVV